MRSFFFFFGHWGFRERSDIEKKSLRSRDSDHFSGIHTHARLVRHFATGPAACHLSSLQWGLQYRFFILISLTSGRRGETTNAQFILGQMLVFFSICECDYTKLLGISDSCFVLGSARQSKFRLSKTIICAPQRPSSDHCTENHKKAHIVPQPAPCTNIQLSVVFFSPAQPNLFLMAPFFGI